MLITLHEAKPTVWQQLDMSTGDFRGDMRTEDNGAIALIIGVFSAETYAPTFVLTPNHMGWIDVYLEDEKLFKSTLVEHAPMPSV